MNFCRVILFTFGLLLLPHVVVAEERSVVLVTNRHCPVTELTGLEIRKAYLGVTISIGGEIIRPMRLTADEELNKIFFQAIVAMSEKSYERRALSLALKFGTPRPAEYSSLVVALEAVERLPCAILFVWARDAGNDEEIKTIKTLWQQGT